MNRTIIALITGIVTLIATACEKQVAEEPEIIVNSISFDNASYEIELNESLQLSANVLPEEAIDKTLKWESSDENTVYVSRTGKITGLKLGEATITASHNEISGSCKVFVKAITVKEIILSESEISISQGAKIQLTATAKPENADDKTIIWSSSDNSIVTVNEEGEVTAVKEGTAVVTAQCGNATADCNVTVTPHIATVGDYFYSDGTFSMELDKSKTLVGIIYWVGDPTESDPTLKKDYPDCTNGLVMSVFDGEVSSWQPGINTYQNTIYHWISENNLDYVCTNATTELDGNGHKILGYNNTKAYEKFNAASENEQWRVVLMDSFAEFKRTHQHPENTSDWFIPSSKEISIICAGEVSENIINKSHGNKRQRDLNKKLQAAIDALGNDKADLLNDNGIYWSSTEMNDGALAINMSGGYMMPYSKDHFPGAVRCVFAF